MAIPATVITSSDPPALPPAPIDLPDDPGQLEPVLLSFYSPDAPDQVIALQTILSAVEDFRLIQQSRFGGPSSFNTEEIERNHRRAAAAHLRTTIHRFLIDARLPKRRRKPKAMEVPSLLYEAMPKYTLERWLLAHYQPTDPCEALMILVVAQAHQDFVVAARTKPTNMLEIAARQHRLASAHLHDMVRSLRIVQHYTRRSVVRILKVKEIRPDE